MSVCFTRAGKKEPGGARTLLRGVRKQEVTQTQQQPDCDMNVLVFDAQEGQNIINLFIIKHNIFFVDTIGYIYLVSI